MVGGTWKDKEEGRKVIVTVLNENPCIELHCIALLNSYPPYFCLLKPGNGQLSLILSLGAALRCPVNYVMMNDNHA